MGVGGGIVIDSDAAAEFRECLLKAEFLTLPPDRFPQRFSLVETLLWLDSFPLLELHLDRLQDSADYFDFPCNRAEIKAALLAHAAQSAEPGPRKVRLLLDPDGAVHIASELLAQVPLSTFKPGRVCIASQRTDPSDRMLFHKTTHRPLYAAAFQAATDAGFDDVLFLNLRDQVTEGAISNLFIQKDGRWFTPPVGCGLLAGVQRRHLLATLPGAEERVLSLEDLRHADGVYLSNAVRGLRPILLPIP